jgi:diadenylate cyclase
MDKISYFIDTTLPWFSLPKNINVFSIIEILILAFLFYHIYGWIKERKAYTLFKGILLILVFYFIADIFDFYVFLWFFENSLQVMILSLAVVFQPELRKALESIGQKKFNLLSFFQKNSEIAKYSDKTIDELISAIKIMSKAKTGALILLQQSNSLIEYEQTGININADISSQLLVNIFEHNTPLHDGALIINNDKITAATCYLPLSENKNVSKSLGTRHRAAIGVSEVTDAIVLIISEETGKISIAQNGTLNHDLNETSIRSILENGQQKEIKDNKFNIKEVFKNGFKK